MSKVHMRSVLAIICLLTISITRASMAGESVIQLSLPFRINSIAISCDGRFGLAWGDIGERSQRREVSPSKIALIDLESGSIVSQKTLTISVRSAALTSKTLCCASMTGTTIYSFKLPDLSDGPKMYPENRATALACVSDSKLLTLGADNSASLISLPDLKPLDGVEINPEGRSVESAMPAITRGYGNRELPTGWYLNGHVLDSELRKVTLAAATADSIFWPAHPQQNNAFSESVQIRPWSTRKSIDEETLSTGPPTIRDQFRQLKILLPFAPAYAQLLEYENRTEESYKTMMGSLVFSDLLEGVDSEAIPLIIKSGTISDSDRREVRIVARSGIIIIFSPSHAFIVHPTSAMLSHCKPPLSFLPVQSEFVATYDQPIRLSHRTRGGEPPLLFGLQCDYPGISIDSKSGIVTLHPLDSESIVAKCVGQRLVSSRSDFFSPKTSTAQEPADVLRSYKDRVGPAFERIARRKPIGVPLSYTISINVSDQSGQTASIAYRVLVDVPEAVLLNAASEQKSKQQGGQKNRPLTAASNTQANGTDARLARIEQRLDELEKELRTMRRARAEEKKK